ncbi:unnamed protein product, partial [Polarella glacialis]
MRAPSGPFSIPGGSKGIGTDEAAICVGVALALLTSLVILHLLLISLQSLIMGCCRYTLPHRLASGAWEAHLLLLLAYPCSCASTLLIMLPFKTEHFADSWIWDLMPGDLDWQEAASSFPASAVAAVLLALMLSTAVIAAALVARAVSSKEVVWMPEASEAGDEQQDEDDEEGRYCDVLCDQLSSRPTETAWPCC